MSHGASGKSQMTGGKRQIRKVIADQVISNQNAKSVEGQTKRK